MLIQSSDRDVDIDYYALATLKQLAKHDAMKREIKVSSTTLAAELDISGQTASRRLQTLENAGLIHRQPVSDGQNIFIREPGKDVLWSEYEEYLELFDVTQDLVLTGTVTDGLGEGKHFVSLPGYLEQFIETLGYHPFAGTLNVSLTPNSVRTRRRLAELDPIHIDGWTDGERTFGPVYCYPAKLETEDRFYSPVHLVVPERTDHDEEQVELLAPDGLRDKLGIDSGSRVSVHVARQ